MKILLYLPLIVACSGWSVVGALYMSVIHLLSCRLQVLFPDRWALFILLLGAWILSFSSPVAQPSVFLCNSCLIALHVKKLFIPTPFHPHLHFLQPLHLETVVVLHFKFAFPFLDIFDSFLHKCHINLSCDSQVSGILSCFGNSNLFLWFLKCVISAIKVEISMYVF